MRFYIGKQIPICRWHDFFTKVNHVNSATLLFLVKPGPEVS